MKKVCIGIDPGVSGAVAVVASSYSSVKNIPTLKIRVNGKSRSIIDIYSLKRFVDVLAESFPGAVVYMEKVHSMPGQGVQSSFLFGEANGILHGMFAAKDFTIKFVRPQEWKANYPLLARQKKDASLLTARAIFPTVPLPLKKDHNKAEALLIANFGLHKMSGRA